MPVTGDDDLGIDDDDIDDSSTDHDDDSDDSDEEDVDFDEDKYYHTDSWILIACHRESLSANKDRLLIELQL